MFIAAVFDSNNKIFVVYITFFTSSNIEAKVHSFHKLQIVFLIATKISIVILPRYVDFANIFFLKFLKKLPKYIKIHDYSINLVDDQQLLFSLIYSVGQVALKILKTYIKINLVNNSIKSFKFSTSTFILFIQKCNSNFWLCINY